MANEIETKLAAARTRLILDKPFLGALVLRLPMVAGDPRWCKTTGTDARNFYYNGAYIEALSVEQTQFVLAHEALHCALSHFARRQHRVKHRWDVACDFAVNPILIEDGLKPPPNALFMDEFRGMTAEEIYPALDDLEDQEPLDQHLYDRDDREQGQEQRSESPGEREQRDQPGSDGDRAQEPERSHGDAPGVEPDQTLGGAPQPPPLSDSDREALSVQWQQRLAGAAQQAMQAGKMGDAMARLVDHLLQPQLPWRMLLARYMTATARDDYSFQRPSRREGSHILPRLRSSQVDVLAVLDTSGSISDQEMREFVSEIDAIKGQLRASVTLLACDDKLSPGGPWMFEPWEQFELPGELHGGGGTSFVPPFDWVQRHGREPDLLVYFTDADGVFPDWEPGYPVIWLVKGKKDVPWGQRIQLN